MKKVNLIAGMILIVCFFSVSYLNAQNLVVNGDLEAWTAGEPDNWGDIENISQESTNVYEGSYAAKHTSANSTKDFNQTFTGLTAGEEYTISYWYLDNDSEARTRIWSYWKSGDNDLSEYDAEILRPPSTWSEDNAAWQQFNETLTAPPTADGFRFEVRVYKQDGNYGGAVYYDDFIFSGDVVVNPEPSEYPTDFTATPAGLSIELAWTDATGDQLPSAYVVYASTSSSLPVPVDGTPETDDSDLSDGEGVLNVNYGLEAAMFSNLSSSTTYYFSIYPYSNNGTNIDYKTDGTAPADEAMTGDIVVLEYENFDDEDFGNWSTVSVTGAQVWEISLDYGEPDPPCAVISGYDDGAQDNEDWMISPAFDFNSYINESITFNSAKNYTGPDLELMVSTDYDGVDPSTATWTSESFSFSTGYFDWMGSGIIDLSAYEGDEVYIGFKYTSTTAGSSSWEIDEILITGEAGEVILPEPSNYPTEFVANASSNYIGITWTDAIGDQLPENYIILAGTSSDFDLPVDGTPIEDDTDLSDGSGAMNVAFGIEQVLFEELELATTYYFTIYPYTNSNDNIDYKTDDTAPTDEGTTTLSPEPTNYPDDFAANAIITTIDVTWTDATGSQLPEAYILYVSTSSSLPTPVDGTPVEDDTDLTDGEGAVNIFYGVESNSFSDLDPLQTYYFTIYPYTNGGEDIDFKTDGTAPTAEAMATYIPEPSNFPTEFAAEASTTSITLNWTDAIGDQLPEAYIVYASTSPGLPVPDDGVPVPDDTDLSDGYGALNVAYGIEECTYSGLEAGTTIYFSIHPYTNSGSNIDYKVEGIIPTTIATTLEAIEVVTIEEENFDTDWGNWTPISLAGGNEWDRNNTFGIDGTPCATMTGHLGNYVYEISDDWLVSPELDLSDLFNVEFSFWSATGYWGDELLVKVSEDYDGLGDPSTANWTDLEATLATNDEFWTWTYSDIVDLSEYDGSSIYLAFLYTSTTDEAATWEVDDILITGEGEITIDPEPTNYPTSFEANASGSSIMLTWADASGDQLPDKYVIYAGTSSTLPTPADGTPVPNDTDISDGSGVLNVSFGLEEAMFSGLEATTTYYFTIYSYTNSGEYIDYKNDGTAPADEATTETVTIVTIEEENFDADWGNWTPISLAGGNEWDRNNTFGIDGTPCAAMTGHLGNYVYEISDDWLVSPELDLSDFSNVEFTFWTATGYWGNELEVKVSENYDGLGDPSSATWTDLNATIATNDVFWTWTYSDIVNLSAYSGSTIHLAFLYTSTTAEAATWEVDDIIITGEGEITIDPEPTNYPTSFEANASGSSIMLTWNDATGEQLPDKYVIYAGTSSSLPTPADGIPVPNDTDLSDGSGVLNVSYGMEEATFSSLDPLTTYYFSIYPYTNNGVNIDFKNDGTAPSDEATTGSVTIVTLEEENFDADWGNWTPISLAGGNEWDRNNTFGIDGTPCAAMTGHLGNYVYEISDDWLVSPELDLSDFSNVEFTFWTATGYWGNELEVKVSENYDGMGDPSTATWTDLEATMATNDEFWTWTYSDIVSLSAYSGSSIHVAFLYTSTTAEAATWEVDDILITGEGEVTIDPEPTNYPTSFEANASGASILITWTDATGEQLPDKYIVFAGLDASLPVPVDGTPISDDNNLSDGSGAINIAYGMEEAMFASLDPSTTYYFSIYPFTNNGVNIDYKNDGSAPADEATTLNVEMVIIDEEGFDADWGMWTPISLAGDNEWDRNNTFGIDGTPCAAMTGHLGNYVYEISDDWLVSPELDLSDFSNVEFSFWTATGYWGNELEVKVSENYDGLGDPSTATWTDLEATIATNDEFWTWTYSDIVSLSAYSGSTIYVAFLYTSTTSEAATWEIDNILITGEQEIVVQPEPTSYPESFAATGQGLSVKLTWDDATGEQLPHGYVIFGSDADDLPMPTDGIPVQIDSDLSDGQAAISIPYGTEIHTFNSLIANTTYYFSIYSFTNSGAAINYKNDDTAPTANAETNNVETVVIESENFDVDWGNWTPISVIGINEWDRDNTFGSDYSPCAAMTGHLGNSVYEESEDWLVSPSLDFNTYSNVTFEFYSATGYWGNDVEVLISTDYDGNGDPNSASWTNVDATIANNDEFWTWTYSGLVSLANYSGDNVHLAFLYTSTTSEAATWELDDMVIKGDIEASGVRNQFGSVKLVQLYPNPSTGTINVDLDNSNYDRMKVLSLSGRVIEEIELSGIISKHEFSYLKDGVYFILFVDSSSGKSETHKLILH